MLNLSTIINELTEEQMDRVLEFKAGGKSHDSCGTSKSKSKSKSCSWTSGHK
ncbi:hypothetical protein CYFUS_002891 [Cystobacter fuscus]|uniref:Uncharacterized protein n=1 Tax=Cystobacter fuscus TaxID=43 RepID=A0A250J0G4_9BACT|nr:hypothetical protein CYFUS_002891 [Cystobacter fuscus]